jgi:hypothetical protein
MNKRIEQLAEEGFSAEEALKIATAEIARAKQLMAEGFAAEKVVGRAINEIKRERLVAAKRLAGLEKDQAEGCATAQCNHDLRLRAEALKSKNTAERSEARAAQARDEEVAAALLAELNPAKT